MRLLSLAAFAAFCMAGGGKGAGLLTSESLLNRSAVDILTRQYTTNTAGSSFQVILFPPEYFGIVSAMSNVKWLLSIFSRFEMSPLLTYVLTPAYFNFTSATITYRAQEGGQVMLEWAALGVMTLPSIGMLLLRRYLSKRK